MTNPTPDLHVCTMDSSAIGRMGIYRRELCQILYVSLNGKCRIRWGRSSILVPQSYVKLTVYEVSSTMHEIQDLVNTLVSTGNDQPRVLSRQVATLMAETRGALSRDERLQAAAMLACACGLFDSGNDAEEW